MTTVLETLLGAATLLVLLPSLVLFVEVLAAGSRFRDEEETTAQRVRIAVLMPAHDEAAVITKSLRSVLPQLRPADRLLVVADNCSDETARIAMEEGAEVIARSDLRRRGKGYALDFGIRHLAQDAPDVVVVVDADCQVAECALDRLAQSCVRRGRPAQALYLMRAPEGSGIIKRVSEFAWTTKNQVRASGLHRLGLPCQLTGSGMAFPWSCIYRVGLATDELVEDLKLGIDLASSGLAPVFCPQALVLSEFPTSIGGTRSQRKRWEHGHLGLMLRVPQLLLRSLSTLNIGLLALALDLSVPPLALLFVLIATSWLAGALFYITTRLALPIELASLATGLFASSVLLAWHRYGRHILPMRGLAMSVPYALGKLPLYVKFLFARQAEWVRSKRDDSVPPSKL